MKVSVRKYGYVIWSSNYVVSIYEDKLNGDTSEKYITMDCRICNMPPHFETVSFTQKEYDEVIIDNSNCISEEENSYEAVEVSN